MLVMTSMDVNCGILYRLKWRPCRIWYFYFKISYSWNFVFTENHIEKLSI